MLQAPVVSDVLSRRADSSMGAYALAWLLTSGIVTIPGRPHPTERLATLIQQRIRRNY